jgi:chromosome segregation ATPase
MKYILRNVPEAKLSEFTQAQEKLRKLVDRRDYYLAMYQQGQKRFDELQENISAILHDAGNPETATLTIDGKKVKLTDVLSQTRRDVEANEKFVELAEYAVSQGRADLARVSAGLNSVLTQAIFQRQQQLQDDFQKQVDALESGLMAYEQAVGAATAHLGVDGPMSLPRIKLRADLLIDSLR